MTTFHLFSTRTLLPFSVSFDALEAITGRCPPLTLAIRAAGRRRSRRRPLGAPAGDRARGSARRRTSSLGGPRHHPWDPPPTAARHGRGARPVAPSCCCCTRSAGEAAPAPRCPPQPAARAVGQRNPAAHHGLQVCASAWCLHTRLSALLSSLFELIASSWSRNFTCAVPVHDVEDIFRPNPVSGKLLNLIFPGHAFQICYLHYTNLFNRILGRETVLMLSYDATMLCTVTHPAYQDTESVV